MQDTVRKMLSSKAGVTKGSVLYFYCRILDSVWCWLILYHSSSLIISVLISFRGSQGFIQISIHFCEPGWESGSGLTLDPVMNWKHTVLRWTICQDHLPWGTLRHSSTRAVMSSVWIRGFWDRTGWDAVGWVFSPNPEMRLYCCRWKLFGDAE